jgi:nitroimidazol reductase NimA-like FMN-containing flavoprotein (pyridoxamine 5'-phosphate oxidase superfamily)
MDGDFGDSIKAWPKAAVASGAPAAWPKTARNKVKRYPDRGSYEQPDIYRILDGALLCHVAYAIDGQPYCTPTSFWREDDRLFWHGSSASRMLRNLAKGVPACLTVCHIDGIVLARSAFHHSINYRSVMAFGTAQLLDDAEEKAQALRAFVNRYFPGRYEAVKQPNPQEVKGTTIITMRIEEASAKTRSGPPRDDEADYGLPIWAGVIPVQTVVGEIVDCPRQHAKARRGEDTALYQRNRRLDEVLTETEREGAYLKGRNGAVAARFAARRQV